jgi:signal transduction histidine kinase
MQQALAKLQHTQAQLIQAEKMSSLGLLVAGVAREVNNPVNFIYGNINHAKQYAEDLLKMLELYQQDFPEMTTGIEELSETIDLEFIEQDLPKVMNSMAMGANRIREIVESLRNFSPWDEAQFKSVYLHQGIESTLLIWQHRLNLDNGWEIEVVKDYGDLPKVECYPGLLNQVFMNLLGHAIDALESNIAWGEIERSPQITIRTTGKHPNWISVSISDNVSGIKEAAKAKLFDPFFTTKPVGKGTGLGLSISYQIIVEKHGGRIECFSTEGEGTEFVIEIPVRQGALVAVSDEKKILMGG